MRSGAFQTFLPGNEIVTGKSPSHLVPVDPEVASAEKREAGRPALTTRFRADRQQLGSYRSAQVAVVVAVKSKTEFGPHLTVLSTNEVCGPRG